jgi:phosphate:Na+ symporter
MVLQSIKLAQAVYISEDESLARQMIEDKQIIKRAETKTNKAHMRRITDKVPETLDTSAMHMDLTRDLRRINSLITSVAYPLIPKEKPTE